MLWNYSALLGILAGLFIVGLYYRVHVKGLYASIRRNIMIKKLNRKCMYTFGWTLKETVLYTTGGIALVIFIALWLNGYLL